MTSHRAALTRLAAYLDGLRTPIDGWQVAKQMQQIAREALGWAERKEPVCTTRVVGEFVQCCSCGAHYERGFVAHDCQSQKRMSA